MRLSPSLAATALTAVFLLAGPGVPATLASPATTWSVSPGGTFTGAATKTTMTDTTTGTSFGCRGSKLTGTLKAGSALPGAGIGSISGGSFDCSAPSSSITVKLLDLPWQVNFLSASGGSVHGTISGLEMRVSLPGCSVVIDGARAAAANGTVAFGYTSSTGVLKVLPASGDLHIHEVKGCFGLVADGDSVGYGGSYQITPRQQVSRTA